MKLVEALTADFGHEIQSSTEGEWGGTGPFVQSTKAGKKLFTKDRPFQHGKPLKRKPTPTPRSHGSSKDNDYNSHIL